MRKECCSLEPPETPGKTSDGPVGNAVPRLKVRLTREMRRSMRVAEVNARICKGGLRNSACRAQAARRTPLSPLCARPISCCPNTKDTAALGRKARNRAPAVFLSVVSAPERRPRTIGRLAINPALGAAQRRLNRLPTR